MPASPFSARRFLITFSIAWFVLIADHVILLYWFDFPLQTAIIDSAISNIPLLGVCLLVINTIR
ncbi:MAG: sensor histidine kinase, partial [Chitinophagaceae bacterium]